MRLRCAPHEFKRGVFTVFRDEDPWKEIHSSIFGKSPKREMSDEEQFFQLEHKRAKMFALRLLARRNLSSYEMINLLESKLVSSGTCAKIIQEFQSLGYINDADWIRQFIHVQTQKKHGPKTIAMKLQGKGIPEEAFKEALEAIEESQPQNERINILLNTKYRNRDLSDYKEKQKVIASLMRRGFDFERIREAIVDGRE